MASPRCNSRDSSIDGDSVYSGRDGQLHNPHNRSSPHSPIAITLPATLPASAAAALLPPQSAAMAAYLGVAAAAAAQQSRLLMGSPLSLMKNNGSPPLLPRQSPHSGDLNILDFSTKRHNRNREIVDESDDNSDSDANNMSKSDANSPLDLSVGARKRGSDEPQHTPARKMQRNDYKPVISPWTSPVTPYFAAAVANLSPKNTNASNDWNGKQHKMPSHQNDATKALEKMSELSRLGGEDLLYKSNNQGSSGGRHSAWQSHWLNKGADSAKDVLKCVWCKQSFPSLNAMSTHMKETKHCGVNVPQNSNLPPPQPSLSQTSNSSTSSLNSTSSNKPNHNHNHHNQQQQHHNQHNHHNQQDLNLLIKETMPLPRKLVRGQDVWLGKGAEQTRQILKCMWCGQSFRSLAEMTSHMQQTQHYTNIISQEQIISWKSSEGSSGGASGGAVNSGNNSNSASGASSTVSAVLTCKVCDQAFTSLKDLSNHMVKNAHYKEHIMRSITESGGRRRQTREKRKKSLPVRKLLELERAQMDFKNGDPSPMKPIRHNDTSAGRITCEKCGDKIDTIVFVDHIRQCVGGSAISSSQKNLLKSALTSNTIIPPDSISPVTSHSRDGRKSINDDISSPNSRHISPINPADLSSPSSNKDSAGGGEKSSSPSVLNAIEQLIEKSFDTRSRHATSNYAAPNQNSAPLGSSILKRLGIDESVDYTKPLIDPQTMNLLRNYQQQQHASLYGRRERSGSESSSVSERGSSRLDSLTPERKIDNRSHSSTPRTTPDKINNEVDRNYEDHGEDLVKIKKEPQDDENGSGAEDISAIRTNTIIKKEIIDEDDDRRSIGKRNDDQIEQENEIKRKRRGSVVSSPAPSPRQTTPGVHSTPIASPVSERSTTPRSTPGVGSDKKPAMGSLGALSSMFDNLTGMNNVNSQEGQGGSGGNGGHGKKQSSNPLAALQKLCDKTENNPASRAASTSNSSHTSTSQSGGTAPGAMLAFSWACNDAVVTSDSIMKCSYCDTPFISKGAYRHHLSKMHFVNPDSIPEQVPSKSQQKQNLPPPAHSPKSSGSGAGHSGHSGNGISGQLTKSPTPGSQQQSPGFEESPHSKFLKYTELAKQLSSKYV